MKIPEKVMTLLNDNEATKVLTSVSIEGIPHTIVVGSTMAPQDDLLCAAEIMMQRTAQNLEAYPNVSVLVVKGMESYQVKAKVKGRQTEGPLFDKVKAELEKMGLPCSGVWLFEPQEVYNQGAGPDAGKKIA